MAPGSSAPKARRRRWRVVVVDVLRAFTTAAYAFAAGARHVYLVAGVDEALAFKAASRRPGDGEEHGRRPAGFDFANSPTELAAADVAGGSSSSAPQPGPRAWSPRGAPHGCGAPGWSQPRRRPPCSRRGLGAADLCDHRLVGLGAGSGLDDLRDRRAHRAGPPRPAARCRRTARSVADSTRRSGRLRSAPGHVHPQDIERAVDVDAFDFAMEVTRVAEGLRLDRVMPG